MKQSLERGTIFQMVAALPGPDMATGIVVECIEPGTHRILLVNFTDGSIFEHTSDAMLYPSIPYPGQFEQLDADKLRAALSKEPGDE